MTGFTSVTREDERATITVTIRALNHRYLDLQLRVPQSIAAIEGDVRGLVGKHVAIRPTERDGVFDLIFRHVTVKSIDFHNLA